MGNWKRIVYKDLDSRLTWYFCRLNIHFRHAAGFQPGIGQISFWKSTIKLLKVMKLVKGEER